MLLLSLKRSNAPLKKFQILVKYSTLPKQAAGKFTSNKLITEPSNTKNNINEVQRTLVYIGPFAETMKRYKMTASFFGICGIIAVPGLISTGQAPMLSVALAGISAISPAIFVHFYTRGYVTKLIVYDDIKKVERERKRPKEMKDKFIGLETISFWGRFKEENMWLSQLKYKSTTKGLVWQQNTGSKHIFTLEREIIEADPYLNALSKRIQRKQV
ncbi:hypothetical protein G6F46_006637 [Rhizopus delemar]|uniref:Uncharacterized protein n=2 Tax=Rhizopus TaxID=4842 RepID=A0A9P7CQ00_9FUNG|nr:hypothetical protein G6F43_002857 [Rhizopus delemar]KAG1541221.1 hypothetical protein G6F51_008031 [Rhizopus arrhizus]KAG1458079.1 hypothetical protein G6F55_005556 [Rhizopus delemar]KAG1495446.1 hypothetical protein G6F54_007168 [Rhizopus delemar]KAG1512537.1 hypothetical protein G6F53_005115 [Rhizopus delemar]